MGVCGWVFVCMSRGDKVSLKRNVLDTTTVMSVHIPEKDTCYPMLSIVLSQAFKNCESDITVFLVMRYSMSLS